MPVRLTETAISKAVGDASESGTRRNLADAGGLGPRLRLTPAGGNSWVLACREPSRTGTRRAPRRLVHNFQHYLLQWSLLATIKRLEITHWFLNVQLPDPSPIVGV